MIINNQGILFIIIFITMLYIFSLLKKIIYRIIPKKWIDIFSIIIMKIAEKYVSKNGNLKMEFCTAIILYIYKKLNFINELIKIPTEEEVKNNLQNIFYNYSDEINQVKNIMNCNRERLIKKDIQEITNEKKENEK